MAHCDFDFGGEHNVVSYPKGYKNALNDGDRLGMEGNKITIMDDWKSLIGLILYFVQKEGAELMLEQKSLSILKTRSALELFHAIEVDSDDPLLLDYEEPAKLLRDYIYLTSTVCDVTPDPMFKLVLQKCGLLLAQDSLKGSEVATGSPHKK